MPLYHTSVSVWLDAGCLIPRGLSLDCPVDNGKETSASISSIPTGCQKKFTRIYSKHRHKKTQHKNQTVENTILPSTPAPNTSTTVNSNLSKRKRSEESENEESENAGVKKFRADISGKRKRTDDTQNIGNTSKFFKKWTWIIFFCIYDILQQIF